jgi:hypothetical protein
MSAVAPLLKPLGLRAPDRTASRPVAKSRPRLVLVAPPRSSAGRLPFAILIGAVLVGGLVTLLMLHTIAAQDGFTVNKLQAQQKVLNDQLQSLQTQVQTDSSPTTLREQAAALGMVPSVVNSYHRMKDGRVKGLLSPVVAAAPVTTTTTAATTPKTAKTATDTKSTDTKATATTAPTTQATTKKAAKSGPTSTTTTKPKAGTTSSSTTTMAATHHAGHPHP